MLDREILDIARLEEAFEDDVDGIASLLEMALETGAKHRRALREGLGEGSAEKIARAAHGIKGSAGNIGANVVYRLAAELDARARGGEIGDAEARIDEIDAAYARVALEVRAYRAQVTPR